MFLVRILYLALFGDMMRLYKINLFMSRKKIRYNIDTKYIKYSVSHCFVVINNY